MATVPTPSAGPAAQPPSPAAQVAQGLATVHFAPAAPGAATSGASAGPITINLHPGSLGAVQVRIERDADGAANITLQAEKPETLRVLQQDSAHLHQALDRAGVFSDGRTFVFELSQGNADATRNQGAFQTPDQGAFQNSGQNNGAGQQQGHAPRSPQGAVFTAAPDPITPPTIRNTVMPHAGINITA